MTEIQLPINEILLFVQERLKKGEFKQNKFGIYIKDNLIEVTTCGEQVSVRIRLNAPELARDCKHYKAQQRKLELLRELDEIEEQFPELAK